jgi:hypothetical protein
VLPNFVKFGNTDAAFTESRRAERERMTVAEWVRRTLRAARKERSRISPETKLEATRKAAEHAFPVYDIEEMLDEIDRGYLHDRRS